MKVLPVLLVLSLIVVAGCGTYEERSGGGPASTSQHPDTGPSLPFDEAEATRRPPIVLVTTAGRQEAVPGSSCVLYVDEASGRGVEVCATHDRPSPEQLSTVRPGEEIRISLEDASVSRPEGCVGQAEQDCVGRAAGRPLGCEGEALAEIPLAPGPATIWRVELAPGAYEVDVFAYFDARDGRTGDVSGSLGVLVDETAPLEIVPAPDPLPACPAR